MEGVLVGRAGHVILQVVANLHTCRSQEQPIKSAGKKLVTGVIGNLTSPVNGTPAQNTLAILEPPSKMYS